ncbi:hypothetical protein Ppa06_70050 [Planomonospora parontospora subsp. parontospora]|uniref:Uncharacterized protein n=2 Tax=Planomonospora parontospora TaxID=58119 RepID=A0AA37F7L6_9ACTN|nr:hypothetical protein [Planomonospora parontospora]GGK94010.1 hypothetical protein GCM10010126_61730 [Planomonospora parontospora]GII13207.1 hypothetical protein Ppa06_70050 [Planomonospora parontospora subsp. parontospora]
MPRTPSDPPGDICSADEHLVTVMWEFACPDAEVGICEEPDCDPEEGYWFAACGLGDFIIEAPQEHYGALWAFAAQHEQDPQIGQGLDRLPDAATQ